MTILTLRLALFVAVLPVVAFAQNAPPTIQGRVFAADSQAALPRARVTVLNTEPVLSSYTNDHGEFSIAAPPAESFTLSVVKAGYAAMQLPLRREAFDAARPVAIALTRSAAVSGQVVDTNGETIVGQRVYADRLDLDGIAPGVPVKFFITTDDLGEYRLGGLPPGRYSVTATDAQDPGAVVTLDLRPGDEVVDIGFTTRPLPASAIDSTPQPPETPERGTVRGRVMTTTGRAIARAVVNITGPMPPRYLVTDAQGRFAFPGLIPGDYELRASKGDFLPSPFSPQTAFESSSRIAVAAGARVNDVTLVLSRGLAVTGTIVDRAGEPLQGVSVQALELNTSGNRLRAVVAGALIGGSRQTDDRGRYRVLGLQPGSYVIAALADAASLGGNASTSQNVPIYFPGSASIADAVPVTITKADVDGIDFAIGDVPTARVTGVAFDSTGAPLGGSITLAVSHRSRSVVPDPRSARIKADGTFELLNVAPGDYVVQAVKNPSLLPLSDLQLGRDPREAFEFDAQLVTVASHDADPIILRTSRGAVVDARIVVDSALPHDPYDRMQIEGVPVSSDLAPISVVASRGLSRLVDGRFRIPALTGPRRFVLSDMPDGFYLKSMTIDGADVTDRVVDFGLGGGSTVSAEIVLSAKGGSIVGRLTVRRTARPVSSVIVFPQDRQKWFERSRFVKVVRASQDGSFRAGSLPPGEYYVAAVTGAEPAEMSTPEALERLLARAARVTLDEGEERKVDVLLP